MSPRRRGVIALRDQLSIRDGTAPGGVSASLRRQLADLLRQDILTGAYAPGQRLIERELVGRFGVSSIPVREALQDLEAQGLVVKRPNAGCSVINLTRDEIGKIIRLLLVLHPEVMRWAADVCQPAHAVTLHTLADQLELAGESGDVRIFFPASLKLQQAIWGIAANPWAARTLELTVGSILATSLRLAMENGFVDLRADAAKFRQLVVLVCLNDGPSAAASITAIINDFAGPLLELMGHRDTQGRRAAPGGDA